VNLKRPVGMEENLAVVMMRVRRNVRTALREVVREEGLTQNEIEVLLFLQRGTFDTARDISQVRGMPRSLVSKAVDQLVRRGLVEAVHDQSDRRVVRLRLLPSAQQMVDRLVRARQEFFAQLCQGVTEQEASAFYSMVGKMTENLDRLHAVQENGKGASL
jgi:DNA-binding MarR family transcriptional regulator